MLYMIPEVLAISLVIAMVASKKLPRKLRRFMQKYPTFSSLSIFFLVFYALGESLVGFTFAATLALVAKFFAYVSSNTSHFQYLIDIKESIEHTASNVRDWFKEYGKNYKGTFRLKES